MPIIFFKDWFFGNLPQYYKDQDTYKNQDGEGLAERYLRVFGDELDEDIKPFIDNFLDLFDAAKCRKELLPHMAFILGSPISIDDTEDTYRRVIEFAIQIYKIKGTEPSYEMLFNFIHLEVIVLEDEPQGEVLYDSDFIYDQEPNISQYDTGCASCSGYSLAISNVDDPLNSEIDPELLMLAQKIICFLQPINAQFNGYVKRVNITEPFEIDIEETTSLDNLVIVPGSFNDSFDTEHSFD